MADNKDQKLILAFQKYAQGQMDGCENKCNDGMIPVPVQSLGRNYISREMAMDAGMPEMEGESMPEPEPDWDWEPCEKCAPIRELELCWHEKWHYVDMLENNGSMWKCEQCGWEVLTYQDPNTFKYPVPDLTTKLHTSDDGTVWYVCHVMEVLGLWERFVLNLNFKIAQEDWGEENPTSFIIDKIDKKIADILTNGTRLRDAALAFMEEVG